MSKQEKKGSCMGWVFIAAAGLVYMYAFNNHFSIILIALGMILIGVGIKVING